MSEGRSRSIRRLILLLTASVVLFVLAANTSSVYASSKAQKKADKAQYAVTVHNINSNTVIKKGSKLKIQYTATRTSGGVAKDTKVKFTSSNKKIATVSKSGVIKARKNGTVKITVYCKSSKKNKKTIKIKVGTPVSSIKISGHNYLLPGKSSTLKAAVNKKATNKKVTWKTDNAAVAAVSKTGVVTGKSDGICTIYAKAKDGSGITGSITVYVKDYSAEETRWVAHRGLHVKYKENTARAFEAAGSTPGIWGVECDLRETKAVSPSMPPLPAEPDTDTAETDAETDETDETADEIPSEEISSLVSVLSSLPEPDSIEILDHISEVEDAWASYNSITAEMSNEQKWAVRCALMTDDGRDLLAGLFDSYSHVERYRSMDIVINHDADFSRTMGLKKSVNSMTASEIRSALPEVCFFDKYLDICKKYNKAPVVEFKSMSNEAVKKAVDMIYDKGLLNDAVFISFHASVLSEARSDAEAKRTGVVPETYFLFNSNADPNIKTAAEYGFDGISVSKVIFTDSLISSAASHDLKLGIWSYGDTLSDYENLYHHYAESGTDYSLEFVTVDYLPFR